MSESKGKQRRFTAEEKRAILAEAEQPGVTITAVCRKHRIAVTQFYRWRAVAEQGVEAALKTDARGRGKGSAGGVWLVTRRPRRSRILVMQSAQHRIGEHARTRRQSVPGI